LVASPQAAGPMAMPLRLDMLGWIDQ